MSDLSSGRVSVSFKCSAEFKAWITDAAHRAGKSVSDFIVTELAEVKKFDGVSTLTSRVAAEDDWKFMAETARDGKQLP